MHTIRLILDVNLIIFYLNGKKINPQCHSLCGIHTIREELGKENKCLRNEIENLTGLLDFFTGVIESDRCSQA